MKLEKVNQTINTGIYTMVYVGTVYLYSTWSYFPHKIVSANTLSSVQKRAHSPATGGAFNYNGALHPLPRHNGIGMVLAAMGCRE